MNDCDIRLAMAKCELTREKGSCRPTSIREPVLESTWCEVVTGWCNSSNTTGESRNTTTRSACSRRLVLRWVSPPSYKPTKYLIGISPFLCAAFVTESGDISDDIPSTTNSASKFAIQDADIIKPVQPVYYEIDHNHSQKRKFHLNHDRCTVSVIKPSPYH